MGAVDGRLYVGTKWKKPHSFLGPGDHKIDSYTLFPTIPAPLVPKKTRQDITAKFRYAFSPRAALGFSASAYHAHDVGLSAGTDPFSGIYSQTHNRSNDSTQSYAIIGDFLPTNRTTLQVRLYDSRFDQSSQSTLLDTGGLDGTHFDLGNLNERYHRADATIRQQLGSWQFFRAVEWAARPI